MTHDTRPDIPLGFTYDARGNLLTYKDSEGYWVLYTYGDKSYCYLLTYEDSDGYWFKYTRDRIGKIVDKKEGRK